MIAAVAAGLVLVASSGLRGRLPALLGMDGPRPTPTTGSAYPLGHPSWTRDTGSYAFMAEGPDGQPARYDPCREIHVVVNERRQIPDGDELIRAALHEISVATGLRFVVEGTTDEVPVPDRPPYQPERYGDRWAPVLIAWSDPVESGDLASDVAGIGGSDPILVEGHAVYVTGAIVLDGAWMQAKGNYGGGYATQAIVMHELGHLVGLGHVSDPSQLMYEHNDGQRGLGDGDRSGLAVLGSGPCIPEL